MKGHATFPEHDLNIRATPTRPRHNSDANNICCEAVNVCLLMLFVDFAKQAVPRRIPTIRLSLAWCRGPGPPQAKHSKGQEGLLCC